MFYSVQAYIKLKCYSKYAQNVIPGKAQYLMKFKFIQDLFLVEIVCLG